MPRKESESAKRRITPLQHRPVKMQRIDERDYSNLVTGIAINTFPGISAVEHTYGAEGVVMGRSATRKKCY